MNYTEWVQKLKIGDPVIIRHPWQDKDQAGGRTEQATVTLRTRQHVQAGGYMFRLETGKAGPYQELVQIEG